MRHAFVVLTVPLCFAACDRPPEPGPSVPASRTTTAPASTAVVAQAPATATSSAPPAATSAPPVASSAETRPRCIVPTPDDPPAVVPKGPDPRCPADADGKPPKVPEGRVSFPGAKDGAKVTVEVMREEKHRERGLMFRKSLADDRGMIFVFDDVDQRGFWMHNTCLPLDMLFLDADGTIVSILENVPTMNDAPRRSGCAAKYVLEVNAGYCRKHGIKAGQRAVVEEKSK